MVVLKKIKASTLMETLVATVLIVVIFMMASMILNTIFSNTIKNSTRVVEAQLHEIQYLYLNDAITLPYTTTLENWTITVARYNDNNQIRVAYEAINSDTKKTILKEDIETK